MNAIFFSWPGLLAAVVAPQSAGAVRQDLGHIGPTAKIFFFAFIALSLGITYWAARRTKSTSDFYAAGHSVTGVAKRLRAGGRLHECRELPGHRRAGREERV